MPPRETPFPCLSKKRKLYELDLWKYTARRVQLQHAERIRFTRRFGIFLSSPYAELSCSGNRLRLNGPQRILREVLNLMHGD